MQSASLGSSGPKKHDNGGRASALDGDGVGRGKTGASAQGATACASTCPQSNAQSIIDKGSSTGSASSGHADSLAITKAESEMRQFPFAARGPGNKPAAAVGTQNTKIPNRKKNLQPMPPRPPHGQMPQSTTQGQTSQPAQEQTPQPTQERALAAQPTQGQTSQLAREQTPQSPEQQTPQTTGGQKPPANGSKRRSGRAPATTATSATTAAPRR